MLQINPLTIIKQQFKDPAIDDVYIVPGNEIYEYGKGYKLFYDVIVAKRISADIVKKFAYEFCNKSDAINFMKNLYKTNAVSTPVNVFISGVSKCITEDVNPCISANATASGCNFSFGDDDTKNTQSQTKVASTIMPNKPVRKKWEI